MHPDVYKRQNHRFPANMNHVQRKKMIDVMVRENTDVIESVKYHALMKFSIHYNAVIEVKGQSLGKYGEAQEKLSGKPYFPSDCPFTSITAL